MNPLRARRASGSKLAAVVLLFTLLAGVGEVHGHHGASHDGDLGAPSRFTPAASHPNLPHHVEAGSEAERPYCAACLHSVSARGLHLPLAAVLRLETRGARLPLGPDRHPSDPCAFWVGGRSPPLA